MSVVALACCRRLAVLLPFWAALSLTGCAHIMPTTPELSMAPAPGSDAVDPRKPVMIEARGTGSRLLQVEVLDQTGKRLAGKLQERRYVLSAPLDFGMQYRVLVRAENMLGMQRVRQEMQFTTVAMPRLEGGSRRVLDPGNAVTLRFDRPVGRITAIGEPSIEAQPDEERRAVRIIVPHPPEDRPFALTLKWETAEGVPLPPLVLELERTTAPPLRAQLDLQGRSRVGVAHPLSIAFSDTLADREAATRHIQIRTADGAPVTGRWHWAGERRLRFTPQPHWPSSTGIEVTAEPGTLRTTHGGTLEAATLGSFTTGPDRRIAVYLDSQRAVALEDGQVVRSFKVSTGKPATPTVTGSFYIYARYPLKTMKSDAKPGEPGHYVVENVPYAQYFHKDYALHGAWWHNGFGRPASHGCVNLATRTRNRRWPNAPEDAGWLYEWASLGVPVTVYAKTP